MINPRAVLAILLLLQGAAPATLVASADVPSTAAKAQDDARKHGFFRKLGRSLRDTALDTVDQTVSVELRGLLDSDAGRVERVQLAGRRADYVIVDVRYDGVRQPDGVFVTATASVAGAPVSLLTPTPVPLSATTGKARLALRVEEGADLMQVDSLDVRLVRAADRSILHRAVFPLDLGPVADTTSPDEFAGGDVGRGGNRGSRP
jgi:hypothetical protein